MGASRKLQGEIERVLKKVQEGVDVFDSIWNKVYDTENANQKEKFEADLKKEIKKLQRYRDQIKTWIQSSEIKDKKALLDARKLIEREMERFKVCEKETKTKAFSKEGLGQQPKTDPREKAKGESRDWLNNMVNELESQVDTFEAELEGLSVKKGKSKPPRLSHLEDSITRHKAHIVKLELILRLLDNDELSPEQVNDVKEFVEDYVERNQDDFEDFADVDELYSSLPLDKMEALENLDAVPVIPPAVLVKEKAAVAAASGSVTTNGVNLKQLILSPTAQQTAATVTPASSGSISVAQVSFSSQPLEDIVLQESTGESGTWTLPVGSTASPSGTPLGGLVNGSVSGSSTGLVAVPLGSSIARGLGVASPSALLSAAASVRGGAKPSITAGSSAVSVAGSIKEEEVGNMLGRRAGPGIGDVALARVSGRGSVPSSLGSAQSLGLNTIGIGSGSVSGSGISMSTALGAVPVIPDLNKRTGLVGDEILVSGGVSPLSTQNRVFLQASTKLSEASAAVDTASGMEGGIIGGRIFTPSVASGGQWRPHAVSAFQNQTESFLGRTEIAPDQKQKYIQRLQHVQQQHGALLGSAQQLSLLPGTSEKQQQVIPSQQSALLQQAQLQLIQQQHAPLMQASQSAAVQQQQQQIGLLMGVQAQALAAAMSQNQQEQQITQSQQLPTTSSSPQILTSSGSLANEDSVATRERQQNQQKVPEDVNSDSATLNAVFPGNVFMSEDDLKNSDTFDAPLHVQVGGPGTLAELSQLSRDVDLAPGQPVQAVQPSTGPGVIGRRSGVDLGAIGDNLTSSFATNAAGHDQLYNLQMLEAAYHKIPLPKDSERLRNYVPRHPAITPSSYPQVPAPIIDNPALWERLDTDVLFFAFYYQQGTYQQYLAARELKRQSWRYHKKYNTWFQRHEEPKVTTDEYEQGTYVYFDFHIVHDDFQQGWCQRIKTEFTFEYSYLEDELVA
eukprot:c28285_g1_i2 orf=637-3519(-)